jgi:hypothetical protein
VHRADAATVGGAAALPASQLHVEGVGHGLGASRQHHGALRRVGGLDAQPVVAGEVGDAGDVIGGGAVAGGELGVAEARLRRVGRVGERRARPQVDGDLDGFAAVGRPDLVGTGKGTAFAARQGNPPRRRHALQTSQCGR